ncbi:MAG: hypothetical protein JSW58_08825 [Candidatus Latescibacterota bacterium]|nr:MAG: hypothetical protein JSW58_08825 [Candidatus Latescibacterota bacterium]
MKTTRTGMQTNLIDFIDFMVVLKALFFSNLTRGSRLLLERLTPALYGGRRAGATAGVDAEVMV